KRGLSGSPRALTGTDMYARDVPHAAVINTAADTYSISPALLQALLDEAYPLMPALPALARQYAIDYARELEIDTADLDEGVQHPEANIMATARWMTYMFGRVQNQWAVVEEFYGGGPRGRMATVHLA